LQLPECGAYLCWAGDFIVEKYYEVVLVAEFHRKSDRINLGAKRHRMELHGYFNIVDVGIALRHQHPVFVFDMVAIDGNLLGQILQSHQDLQSFLLHGDYELDYMWLALDVFRRHLIDCFPTIRSGFQSPRFSLIVHLVTPRIDRGTTLFGVVVRAYPVD
jgi:hypothetical protein